VPLQDLVVTHRLARAPHEFVVRTAAARVAQQLSQAGVQLSPGESLRFVYVPGPEKARAWELVEDQPPYDAQAYTELLLRAVESLLLPVGVDRRMLELWVLGNAGYWGVPGALPPPGIDGHAPLLAAAARVSMLRPALRAIITPAPPPADATWPNRDAPWVRPEAPLLALPAPDEIRYAAREA
jgi:hypothetical protein